MTQVGDDVEVTQDLAAALAEAGAAEAFDRLACSKRKEHVRQMETARATKTRQRRIDRSVASLASSL